MCLALQNRFNSGILRLAEHVENMCQVNVLDTDFFVTRLGDPADCSELIGASLLSKMRKEAQKLDYYAKSSVVLHNEKNGVGHHFVKLLKGQGEDFKARLLNATAEHAEHLPSMGRLRLLDLKHFEHVHGYSVEKYCDGNLHSKEAAEWVRESSEIQRYVDCLCIRQQPSLLCDFQHLEELESIRPAVMERLYAAQRSVSSADLLQVAEGLKSKGIGLGPCLSGGGISCNFCVSGQCIDQGGGLSMDHFSALTSLIKGPSGCLSGDCSVCMGLKPGDALQFILSFGVAMECSNAAAMFTSFHIWAALTLCIGGVLGKIASAIGWSACAGLAHVGYFPFINKMTITLSLPIFIPPPLGLAAPIEVNLNLGDLTPAVYNYCSGLGHGEYNCLQSMFDARGPTGVSMGVDVLLGVQIPVLGTVGKWVRILGFDMAEKDNSRELAMNKAGVTIEYIGKSSSAVVCGKTFSNVNCVQHAGDPGFRANTQDNHKGDRFHVYRNPHDPHDPRALCVKRVDRNSGWGMELELACKVDNNQGGGGGILVPLGKTVHNKKCVMPPEPVFCHGHSGNRGHRLGFDSHDDDFQITQEGGRVCGHLVNRRRRRRRHRRRRRNSNGWDLNLVLECDSQGHQVDYVVQDVNLGKSKTNYRCILPTHRMECDHDAGNADKRANEHKNSDTFTIWNSHTQHLCARRTDKHSGWGMDLKIQCKQYEKLWDKVKVTIGGSHHNEKCVPEPRKNIRCDDLAANREYRFTRTEKGDSFYVSQRNGHVCARRTDSHGGWGMNLEIECKALLGPFFEVHIGPAFTASGYKCVLPTHHVECDADAGDIHKRLNPSPHHNTFTIWASHTHHICARRTDAPGGWGMDLKIQCKPSGGKRWDPVDVNVGASHTNEKCVPSPNSRVRCDYLAANPEYRKTATQYADSYHVEHKGNQICVRRTDQPSLGWGAGIVMECKQLPVDGMEVYFGPGYTHSGYRCVLPTHKLECDEDAGDIQKRLNPSPHHNTFTIWTSHTNHICARRKDAAGGWQMDLRIDCKKGQKLWDTIEVDIGSSHTNEKCVPSPNSRVRCDYLAANPEYRKTETHWPDSYHVEHKGTQICVRRTDQPTLGWGGRIVIECKEMFQ